MLSPSKSSRSVFGNAGKTVVSGVHSRAVFDPNGVVPTAPARVGPKPNLGTHRGSLSAADLLGRTPLDRALASESQLGPQARAAALGAARAICVASRDDRHRAPAGLCCRL